MVAPCSLLKVIANAAWISKIRAKMGLFSRSTSNPLVISSGVRLKNSFFARGWRRDRVRAWTRAGLVNKGCPTPNRALASTAGGGVGGIGHLHRLLRKFGAKWHDHAPLVSVGALSLVKQEFDVDIIRVWDVDNDPVIKMARVGAPITVLFFRVIKAEAMEKARSAVGDAVFWVDIRRLFPHYDGHSADPELLQLKRAPAGHVEVA